jgi:2-dehydropantoate 2-reductase
MSDVLWAKLTVTASLTSLGAVTGLRFGPMLRSRTIRDLILRIGTEVVDVGRAAGVAFRRSEGVMDVNLLAGAQTPVWLKHLVVRAIGFKHRRTESSMHASIREGVPTEIDFINGEVVRIGAEHGVAAPVNRAVVEAVKEIEGGVRAPGAESLERLCSRLQG